MATAPAICFAVLGVAHWQRAALVAENAAMSSATIGRERAQDPRVLGPEHDAAISAK